MKRLSRRDFLKLTGAGSAGALLGLSGLASRSAPATFAAAPVAATPEPAGSKILRVQLYGDVQNMDPAFQISNNDDMVSSCVISGLVTYAGNSYDVVNDLAETIKMSADNKSADFKLREGVKWHNGYGEVTTDDVKYSYERYLDKELKSPYAGDWATLDHVQIVDKYNGKIVFKEPFAPLWHSTLPVISGYVICKKYMEEVGREKFATNIMGCGPYLFSEWRPKEMVIVKRNPDYQGPFPPKWDEIHFLPIPDSKAAEIALEAGELDWTRISISSLDRFESNANFKVSKKPTLYYRWIGLNVENPKLKDINVRQAIRYATDVPGILQAAYGGKVDQETGMIAPGLLGYWKDAPKYERDVAKAKDLMKKAGVESLDLRIDTEDTTEYRTWCEVLQQNLLEIGINLTINPMDSSSFWEIGAGEQAKSLELFAQAYSMEPDPSWATMWFTCDEIDVWNWQRWCSADYDKLHQQGLVTMDDKAREQIYFQMQKLFDDACQAIWITHSIAAQAYSPAIKPATTPHGQPQMRFFEAA